MAAQVQYQAALKRRTPSVVFVRSRQARMLRSGPSKIVITALREIDTIITGLVGCRSKAAFIKARDAALGDYSNLSYIIANSFSIEAGRNVRFTAVNEAIKAVVQFIRNEAPARLGQEATAEMMFSFDTLRRAYGVVHEINISGKAGEEQTENDRHLAGEFNCAALWAQFHLDCLRVAVSQRIDLEQEVLDELLQGARLSVMAYSYARQGLDLRIKREPFLIDVPLDEEDRELLDESFFDYQEHESKNLDDFCLSGCFSSPQ
jgi:hypothetical protein